MSTEINLLQKKNDKVALSKNALIIRGIALGSLFIVSFFSIVLFILIALSPLPALQQRVKDESKNLSFYNTIVGKMILTKERLIKTENIIENRPALSKVINTLQDQLPENMFIDSIRVEEKKVFVTFSSASLLVVDDFLTQLMEANNTNKKFQSILLTSIQHFQGSNTYIVTMELQEV